MLPKPMRKLEADEAEWFIELDQRPITEKEINEAKKSLKVFQGIKPHR